MDARTKLPIKDSVDVCRGEFRVVRKKLVDGLLYLGKTSSGILELEKFLDAEELTTFEDRLVFVVDNDVTIGRVSFADEHETDAKLTFHVSGKLFLVGRKITVLLQDGAQLLTSPIVGAVIFQRMLHDELHGYRTQLFPFYSSP